MCVVFYTLPVLISMNWIISKCFFDFAWGKEFEVHANHAKHVSRRWGLVGTAYAAAMSNMFPAFSILIISWHRSHLCVYVLDWCLVDCCYLWVTYHICIRIIQCNTLWFLAEISRICADNIPVLPTSSFKCNLNTFKHLKQVWMADLPIVLGGFLEVFMTMYACVCVIGIRGRYWRLGWWCSRAVYSEGFSLQWPQCWWPHSPTRETEITPETVGGNLSPGTHVCLSLHICFTPEHILCTDVCHKLRHFTSVQHREQV